MKALIELRQTLEGQNTGEERTKDVEAAQALVVNQINTFFHDRLVDRPTIKEYIDQMQVETHALMSEAPPAPGMRRRLRR